jgi:hypothetical protein
MFVVLSCHAATADLHPIVEVRNGYLLGAIADGKAIEADEVAKEEFHPKAYVRKEDSFDAPNAYKLLAVLDLDGDGKMEIVVGSRYYEGEATTIYRCDAKKCEELLSVGCGD